MNLGSLLRFNLTGLLFFFFSFHDILPRQVAAQLQRPVTAKANALGTTYSGSVKDPSALLWNPAGLAHIVSKDELVSKKDRVKKAEKKFEDFEEGSLDQFDDDDDDEESSGNDEYYRTFEFQLFSTVSQLSLDRRVGFASFGFPVVFGSLGFGVLGTQTLGIEGYDQNGISTGALEYNLYALYAGYAFQRGSIRLGVGINGIVENLAGEIIGGGSIDLGIQFFASIFEFGATFQSLGGFVQRSFSEPDQFDRLNIILRTSVAVVIPQTNIKLYLGLTSNLDDFENSPPLLNAGLSYELFRYTSVLLGLNGSRPSVGLELNFPYIRVVYTLNQDELGYELQHYIDLGLQF